MTTPEADAFMRRLDQDPELLERVRARILTRELLQLPETVAQLARFQQETAEQLASFRQETAEQFVSIRQETAEQFASIRQETAEQFASVRQETAEQFASVRQETTEQINALQEAQQQTNERLDTLTGDVRRIEGTLSNLNGDVRRIEGTLSDLTGNVHRIEGTLGNLTGSAYENRAARIAPRLLARYLRMRPTQVLQAPNAETRAHLDDVVNEGVIHGAISDQQAQELERADIIVMARDNEDQTAYVVIEASITVDETDIDRAHERALIMGRLTSMPVRAAVIGQNISPANRQTAEQLGITFMPLSQ